jgi:Protein of unknown function (DUF2612)
MIIPFDEDVSGEFQFYVTPGPTLLAVGDGGTNQFLLSTIGQEMVSANLFGLWRNDWQGNQALYSTARTNNLLQSQNFGQTPWATLGTITLSPTAATTPDGTNTATLVAQTANDSSVYQDVASAGTQSWTASAYVKAATSTNLSLTIFWLTGGATQSVSMAMNPTTGALLSTGTNVATLLNYSITALPNNWYRISVSGVGTDQNNTKVRFQIYDLSAATSSYYLWGAQLEVGNIPTSYVVTGLTTITLTDYTFDALTGLIRLAVAPLPNAALTWVGNFVYEIGELPTWQATIESQYANSPVLLSLIQSFEEAIDPAADIEAFYNLMWNIDTAQGYGLDVWGRIVGVTRVLNIPTTTAKYFGFQEASGAHIEGFNSAVFWNVNIASNFSISDAIFRTLILVKALMNISRTSIQTYNKALMTLFPGIGNCYVVETGPMTAQLTFPAPLSQVQKAILQQTGVFTPPTGVSFTISP